MLNIFEYCVGLTSITIPSSVTRIGGSAFYNCSSLTSLVFEGCPYITTYGFARLTNLKTITLHGMDLNNRVFAGCTNLRDVYNYGDGSSLGKESVSGGNFDLADIENATLHVPSVYLLEARGTIPWSQFGAIKPTDTMDLTDGELFDGYAEDVNMVSITYTRTFSNTNWQGLYVPFTMEYSEWAADFDVARINDIHQYDDDDNGTIDRTELEVIKVTSGSIEANTPYLIRAKETGEKTFTLANRTLYKAEEKSYTVSSWNTLFTFTGTYSGVAGSDMVSNAYYALGDGALRQAASSDNALSPYRWYVAITDRNGAQKDVNEVKLKVWGEDATSLSPLSVSPEGEKTAVYDLSGRRIAKENATKGLYIVNGKKMMVR